MKKILNIFLSKQFLIFVLVGGVNTINGMIFPTIFATFIQANIAYMISYIPSLGISYLLNSYFTFNKQKLAWIKCFKFYCSYIPNFIIQNVIFVLVLNIMGLNKYVAIIAASIIGIPVTFLLMKFFAFSEKNQNSESECDE